MIKVDINKCTGCHRCEVACAFYHTGKTSDRLSRIKVLNIYDTGIDGPVVCIQCKERYCLKCPESALIKGKSGQIIASPTNCNLCGICESLCPIGAIEFFENIVYVCDLCGGDPKCVEACTEQALIFDKQPKQYGSLQKIKNEVKKYNPSRKRYSYLSKAGTELRKKWEGKHA